MNDDDDKGKHKAQQKLRGNRTDVSQSSVVAALSQLLRVPATAVQTQANVNLVDPGSTQTMPLSNSQGQASSQTVIQAPFPSGTQRLLESLVQTQLQAEASANIQCLPQMQHTQGEVLVQPPVEGMHSQMHSQQPQLHTQVLSEQSHIHIQPQQTDAQVGPLSQLQGSPQTAVMHNIGDLIHAQINSEPPLQTSKLPDELASIRIPITRQQPNNNCVVTLQDLSSGSLEMNESPSCISHAKFLSALTSLAESNQHNFSGLLGGQIQSGNNMVLTQPLTNAQLLDALIASKNSNGHNTVAPVSSVSTPGIDSLPVMRLQGNYTMGRSEDGANAALITQDRLPQAQTTLLETQVMNQQISASPLHLDTSKLETTDASVSNFINANKLLNRLLDTTKPPHIPSHIAKAAEIAHLIPNPSVRTASTTRAGDLEDGTLDMTFSTSNRGGSPLTTLTRSSGTSMCTVTGALRSSSGYGDTSNKTLPALQIENINLPSNFQLNNNPVLLSTLGGQNPMPQQRHFDASEQMLLGTQSNSLVEEPRLDLLGHEQQRLFQTLPVSQSSLVSTCAVSGVNILSNSTSDKSKRNLMQTPIQPNNVRNVNSVCLPDMMNRNNSIESHSRSQMLSSTKQGLVATTDPMFHTMATSGSSLSALSVQGLSKPVMSLQECQPRLKTQVADSKITQQLADFMSRAPSSDITGIYDIGTVNIPLELPETRISHTGDVLLSELHRSDETELGLNATLNGAADDLHSNTNTLVTEAALGAGIGADTAPLVLPPAQSLQGLPSPPLPSFSLPNISSDFLGGSISGNKLSSGQGPFPALLSNLATTSDFDQLLENSSMCIDINSLSESEVSLSTAPGTFAYSPEKTTNKKSLSPSSDLTFTSALKAATSKNEDDLKLHSDINLPVRTLEQRCEVKLSGVDTSTTTYNTLSSEQNGPSVVTLGSSSRSKKQDSLGSSKSSSSKEKRKEMFRKNELLVQQVACFKCRLCAFLTQDKGEMGNHMKQFHSQYFSESEDSETEEITTKKVKVHLPRRDSPQQEIAAEGNLTDPKGKLKNNQTQSSKFRVTNCGFETESLFKTMIKEEDDVGKCSIFIKMEPLEDALSKEKTAAESRTVAQELENDQALDDDDTNDSSATNDSGSLKPKRGSSKIGRPVFSKSTGITKLKKSNSNVQVQDKVAGIRCDVNSCGLRMKSESNIEYHRKCHQGAMLVCQECGEKFGMWYNLAVHLWRQHMVDMELHKCDKCNYKSYSYSKLMNVHYKIHSEERPSLCDQCGKRFKTAKQLRSHKAVHMRKLNSPQHHCEKCLRPFSDKRMLRNHMESVHNKVKPFLCNYCGYSTASRSTLKMHMRQHTGEKPFACEKCTYRTADHNSLRRHRMQHSGVRPYRCPFCEYASIQATTFKVHLRDKHPCLADGIVFTCGICKFETIKKDNYLAHVAEHTRGENKKMKENNASTTNSKKNKVQVTEGTEDNEKTEEVTRAAVNFKVQPGTILGNTPIPHVVNIDVESGAVTVESPQTNQFVEPVTIQEDLQTQVPGHVTLAGDQYIYAAVDSSMLSRMKTGDGVVHITPDVVAIPISTESGGTPGIQGVVYVAASNQEVQDGPNNL